MSAAYTLDLAIAALAIEAAFGYPQALCRVIGHPVTWMGALIAALEHRLNRQSMGTRWRMAAGIFALLILLVLSGGIALLSEMVLGQSWLGFPALAVLAASLPAQRSLHAHVRAVADALDTGGIAAGRDAVSRIVGRDPAALDEAGVARAAIESLAENFSDGVVAPAFWMAAAGLTGGVLYKAANTADSMIGHRTPRHEAFGWAAARFDDLVNLPASRLAALLLLLAAAVMPTASARAAWAAIWRDSSHHRSPNAGWPEAATAGALGLRLAGPRVYGGTLVDDAFMGNGRREATSADIREALGLYRIACLLQAAILAFLASMVILRG